MMKWIIYTKICEKVSDINVLPVFVCYVLKTRCAPFGDHSAQPYRIWYKDRSSFGYCGAKHRTIVPMCPCMSTVKLHERLNACRVSVRRYACLYVVTR